MTIDHQDEVARGGITRGGLMPGLELGAMRNADVCRDVSSQITGAADLSVSHSPLHLSCTLSAVVVPANPLAFLAPPPFSCPAIPSWENLLLLVFLLCPSPSGSPLPRFSQDNKLVLMI